MQKFKILKQLDELDRAKETLKKEVCFISYKPFSNEQPHELVWHAGSGMNVYVEHSYLPLTLQKKLK